MLQKDLKTRISGIEELFIIWVTDPELWRRAVEKEEEEQQDLMKIADNYEDIVKRF